MIQKPEISLSQILLMIFWILQPVQVGPLSRLDRWLIFYVFICGKARQQHPWGQFRLPPHDLSRHYLIASCHLMTPAVSDPEPLRPRPLATRTLFLGECTDLPEINADLLAFAVILTLSQ